MRIYAAITIAVSFATFHLGAEAQQKPPIRMLLGANPYSCTSNSCSTPIHVSYGEKDNPKGCTVAWDYNGYTVAPKNKPKLVWVIDAVSGGPYHFHPSDGVMLNPDDENDPDLDLYDQGKDDKDRQSFRWRDRNARQRDKDASEPKPELRGIRFEFWVIRDSDGHRCAAGDPVVINGGE